MKRYVIVDLDDTLFYSKNIGKNLPEENTREAWDKFHKEVNYYNGLEHNKDVLAMLKLLNIQYEIVFVTAREAEDKILENTIESIEEVWGKSVYWLHMRDYNDFRPSQDTKEDMFTKGIIKPEDVALVIDDNADNIKMYQKYNIPTLLITLDKNTK